MRLAVIADMHGNSHALEAILADAERVGVDAMAFLGDFVSDCADPEGVLALAREAARAYPCWAVRGNREEYQVRYAEGQEAWRADSRTGSLLYTAQRLSAADIAYFRRLPRSARYCVDVMKGFSRRALAERIGRARQEADFVIVFPHWGCEYLYEPIEAQRKWAAFFAEAGADLIIGTHPHVVQPVEWVERGDGGRTLCYYSLGNFISCQAGAGTMLGALADVTLERTDDGVRIASHDIVPLVTHTDAAYGHFVTYPLADYTDEMAAENKIFAVVERNQGIHVDCAYLGKLFDDILNYRAQAYNKYKSPWDVNKGNLKGVLNALRGKNVKA